MPAAHAAAHHLRPLDRGGPAAARPQTREGARGPHARDRARVRLGGVPELGLRTPVEHQRRARRDVARLLAAGPAYARPEGGALLGLATAAKFFPVALAPLLAAGTGAGAPARSCVSGLAFAAVCVVALYLAVPAGGPRELWDTTLGYQFSRESPFSLWASAPVARVAPGHPPGRRRRLLRRARVRPAPARRAPGRGARGCSRDRAPALCELLAVLLCHVVRAARAGGDAGGLPAVARRARARSPCLG